MTKNEAASIAMLIYKDISDYCKNNSDRFEEFSKTYSSNSKDSCEGNRIGKHSD